MSHYREQAYLQASAEELWELLSDPSRYTEWWPRVVEVQGDRFEQGDEFVQVTKTPLGNDRTTLRIETLDDLREVNLRCLDTGTYTRWVVADAQGGAFVDAEFGMEATRIPLRAWDRAMGRRYFRSWLRISLEALGRAAAQARR